MSDFVLPEDALEEKFLAATGPGGSGQKVAVGMAQGGGAEIAQRLQRGPCVFEAGNGGGVARIGREPELVFNRFCRRKSAIATHCPARSSCAEYLGRKIR